jgi:hypothetical protein
MTVPDNRHWKKFNTIIGKDFTLQPTTPLQDHLGLRGLPRKVQGADRRADRTGRPGAQDRGRPQEDQDFVGKNRVRAARAQAEGRRRGGAEAVGRAPGDPGRQPAADPVHGFQQVPGLLRGRGAAVAEGAVSNVNETVRLMSDVQKTWSFLLNLFMYSEEVKKELPKESQEFTKIDAKVKTILVSGLKTKNVFAFSNNGSRRQADHARPGRDLQGPEPVPEGPQRLHRQEAEGVPPLLLPDHGRAAGHPGQRQQPPHAVQGEELHEQNRAGGGQTGHGRRRKGPAQNHRGHQLRRRRENHLREQRTGFERKSRELPAGDPGPAHPDHQEQSPGVRGQAADGPGGLDRGQLRPGQHPAELGELGPRRRGKVPAKSRRATWTPSKIT